MATDKITLWGGYIPTKLEGEELQRFLQERKGGCGSHGSKKDYKRNTKHRGKRYE
ncbi:hypothetical protein [uncultured Clostridium sp.]|uniref:hypothetical protein n=1 Tax=uncultured Clostridium sp. TaxID=59620 RepID=UPI0026F3C000|nr:hypothetical protein [uncultured Clostridium sp.]